MTRKFTQRWRRHTHGHVDEVEVGLFRQPERREVNVMLHKGSKIEHFVLTEEQLWQMLDSLDDPT